MLQMIAGHASAMQRSKCGLQMEAPSYLDGIEVAGCALASQVHPSKRAARDWLDDLKVLDAHTHVACMCPT